MAAASEFQTIEIRRRLESGAVELGEGLGLEDTADLGVGPTAAAASDYVDGAGAGRRSLVEVGERVDIAQRKMTGVEAPAVHLGSQDGVVRELFNGEIGRDS
jgi:hypothetical protein